MDAFWLWATSIRLCLLRRGHYQPVPPFISSQRKEISLRLYDMLDLKAAGTHISEACYITE